MANALPSVHLDVTLARGCCWVFFFLNHASFNKRNTSQKLNPQDVYWQRKWRAVCFHRFIHTIGSKAFFTISVTFRSLPQKNTKPNFGTTKRDPRQAFLNCSVLLLSIINGCYILIYMVVHEALRSLILRFGRTLLTYSFPSFLYSNTQSPSISQSLEKSEFKEMGDILQDDPGVPVVGRQKNKQD